MKVDLRPGKMAELLLDLAPYAKCTHSPTCEAEGLDNEHCCMECIDARKALATARALRGLEPKAYEPYLLNAAPLYALGVVEVADGVDK